MAKIIDINKNKKNSIPDILVPPEYIKIEQLIDIELHCIKGLTDIELKYNVPNPELMDNYCSTICRLELLKCKILDVLVSSPYMNR